ncbi:MAG: tRNA (adenosine(37)-N6)-threonylcarbamoyltransferase complex dimerization subunit type 1 TsaB [Pseudomonadota bacterium]|nr:tRNA (adenosine(37)-N6)-threonylcarbamoyltransferase complex dimerization subunit type 1 TsaB [Pseudomonadota bacterium]
MLVLGIDTSLSACSAALYDASTGAFLARRLERMDIGHAERLPLMVRDVVRDAEVGFASLQRIAVTTGPGSFTGTRIGLAFARGLGLALAKPVIGVTSLEALAADVNDNFDGLPIASVIDARRGGIYLQLFAADLTPLGPPAALALADAASSLPLSPLMAVGTGARFLEPVCRDRLHPIRLSSAPPFPDAAVVARLAAGRAVGPPPLPLYLRPPDASLPNLPPRPSRTDFTVEAIDGLHAGILAAMHAECFTESWDEAAFARLMAMPGAGSYLAYDRRREPAGFMLVRQAADEGEILTIGTRPAHRRRGIASILLAHATERMRGSGVRKLFIEVAASNAAARALYARAGFAVQGARPAYYAVPGGDSADAVVMALLLER